jgi:ABC-type antimicrobial peptide transport system permease subunit
MALGSDSRGILALILMRPFIHVASGVLAGTLMTFVFEIVSVFEVLGYGALMLVMCMVGCAAPAIRALRIAPMQALRRG